MITKLDPLNDYYKGMYLKGLVLNNLQRYEEAAVIFEKLTRISSEFADKASKQLIECRKKLEQYQNVDASLSKLENEIVKEQNQTS